MNNSLNEYYYEDIFIGQKESFVIKITESMVRTFGDFSGDLNPLHMDTKFAESTPFKKRIVHGMLLSTFFSRLVGMNLPGKNALYFSQTLNFRSPCYIDDEIEVVGGGPNFCGSTRWVGWVSRASGAGVPRAVARVAKGADTSVGRC